MPLGQGIGEMWGSVRGLASRVVPAQRGAGDSQDMPSPRVAVEMPLELEAIFAHQEQLRLAHDAGSEGTL